MDRKNDGGRLDYKKKIGLGQSPPQSGSRRDRSWEFEAFRRKSTSTENLFSAGSRSESSLTSKSSDSEHIYAEIDDADVSFDPRASPPLPPR